MLAFTTHKRIFMALALAVLLNMPLQGHAQSYLNCLDTLTTINKSNPAQSPRHEKSERILNDRLLDSANQVIGEVKDVILNPQGEIINLDIEFDRLKIGTDRLTISYSDMNTEPAGNGYRIAFSKAQIIEMFPTLLETRPSEAHKSTPQALSLISMQNALVLTQGGKRIGRVHDILFDNLGGKALYLYIGMSNWASKAPMVAVPFDMVSYTIKANMIEIVVSDDMAKAMKETAKE